MSPGERCRFLEKDMGFDFCVPCLFGLEGLAADELKRMGIENVAAQNGKVTFSGGMEDMAMANIRLSTGERVLLQVGAASAPTFDALFEAVKAMPWENFIPMDGAFPVKGYSLDSKLHSIPDCQKIIKKAIVDRLRTKYRVQWFKETGAKYQVQFSIIKDTAYLYLDTTGEGLHKRGYRPVGNAAPLRETLAAAMVKVARYRGKGRLCDPFCGSGTIAIEAALAAKNRAPGINRRFAAQKWDCIPGAVWKTEREKAKAAEFSGNYDIWGGDIDPSCIEIAQENARRAGVEDCVRFETADARRFYGDVDGGLVVTNPPYGERVMERADAERLYREFGAAARKLTNWKIYLLSSHTEFERCFGKTADKKRKLYNGMIKCDLFMYL